MTPSSVATDWPDAYHRQLCSFVFPALDTTEKKQPTDFLYSIQKSAEHCKTKSFIRKLLY